MEPSRPANTRAERSASHSRRLWSGIAKAALGLALLAALVTWGQLDLKALAQLADNLPAVVGCLVLLLATLPLAAIRWGMLLRALGVSISFVNLLHFVGIGVLSNMFLFGTMGGDAVRGLYAWRAVGGTGDRVAVSVLADRVTSMFALLFLCLVFSLFNWRRMQQVPALAALGVSTIIAVALCIIAIGSLFAAPRLVASFEAFLSHWPRVVGLFRRVREIVLTLQTNPVALLAAFVLALMIQVIVALAMALLTDALRIGTLGVADLMLAVPLTLAVNALPLTPGGIGIGEAAFDQICHWLEPMPSSAAYSSIFFAYRIISSLTCLPGLISLVIYRNAARSKAS
jgi:glycosyltransferase 2 family protein